ncbi:two component system sensor kinase of tetrathionate reductase complex [Proteus mirabilis]|nr:two component system sensor kinase of tetrathionate reductase complex [Proteus mirabilis]
MGGTRFSFSSGKFTPRSQPTPKAATTLARCENLGYPAPFYYRIIIGAIILLVFNQIWISYLVRRRSHQLEQAHIHLREQKEALEQAQRLNILGEMASGFAHELNQPLSAIKVMPKVVRSA